MFRKHMLDGGANESVAIADLNNDGKQDVISGENWYSAPLWEKHRLREIPTLNGYVDDFSNFPLDVNADGHVDVIACSWFRKKLFWYENPGRREQQQSPAAEFWREHVIESGFNYELMILADVDGDGKAEEIVPNYGSSGELVWFERSRPHSGGQWIRHVVGRVPQAKGLHGVGAGDLDGDNRADILTAYGWFQAPANPRTEAWTFRGEFRLVAPQGQSSPIHVLDVNHDNRRDLVYGAGHGYGVFWLENKGAGKWEEHVIDDSWSQAHAVTLADLDRDGRPDVITGKRYLAHDIDPGAYEPLGLYWYRSSGDGRYVKHVIDFGSKTGGGMQIFVGDLDGDADLDLVAPGKSGLFLFEQIDVPRQKAR
ncbi:MAG: VCBS repeat-containing protein [Pyrinomonadaceae bacterium]